MRNGVEGSHSAAGWRSFLFWLRVDIDVYHLYTAPKVVETGPTIARCARGHRDLIGLYTALNCFATALTLAMHGVACILGPGMKASSR